MTTQNEHGETVRGFQVWVQDIRPKSKRKGKWTTYPMSGFPLYTGEKALWVMRAFRRSKPKVPTMAITGSDGISGPRECIQLDGMEELFA